MKYEEVVEATGLDARTVRGIARGDQRPHARTLHKLVEGLGVSTEELFAPPTGLSAAAFDAATNPAVDRVRNSHPAVFDGWAADDFAELASQFGVGGELTDTGALEKAKAINAKREVLRQTKVVLETSRGGLLAEFVQVLYERVCVSE